MKKKMDRPAVAARIQSDGAFTQMVGLFEDLPDVFFFAKDRAGRFVAANAAFVRMVGARNLDELLGRTDFDFAPVELATHFVRDDREVLRTGRSISRRVERVPNADGSITWHETSKQAWRDGRGRIVGVLGFTRDLHAEEVSWRRYEDLAPVVEHITRCYGDPLRLPDLAARAHRSVSQFVRRFRDVFGMPPAAYVRKVRLQQACRQLAHTRTKVVEVALACGFCDHSHFTRAFQSAFGVSPGAYRRVHWRAAPGIMSSDQ
ncbi:MAG: AraC family transcriptional regulator [Candidatus Marinimicrobia bacterium]|nr:AraC family transcriptional regulator [Candidatus Neomarinimicrobiota bacterium]